MKKGEREGGKEAIVRRREGGMEEGRMKKRGVHGRMEGKKKG